MKFNELKINERFIILREHDSNLIYTKVNDKVHYNTTDGKDRFTVQGNTQVKEIK